MQGVVVFLLRETFGGLMLGLVIGLAAVRVLRSIDAYAVEGLTTLAVAMGGYSLSEVLELSAPICVVVAGLLIGNQGRTYAMSQVTRERIDNFWAPVDFILNSMLFRLIGLEVLVLELDWSFDTALLAVCAVVIVLASGLVGVAVPILAGWRPRCRPSFLRRSAASFAATVSPVSGAWIPVSVQRF